MDANLKKILKAVTLEFRHALEGRYDNDGNWHPGDLETRLAAIGVWRDRPPKPVDELPHLPDEDKHARKLVDAYLKLREEAGESQSDSVAEFVRETAYTWANRLLALRCMESRELIDEAILQKEAYGGRSLEHHRLAQREPELCTGEDDGRFEMLNRVFAKQAEHLPMLFDPQAPGVALRPSPAVLKRCMALLSGTETVRSHDPATDEMFKAPDALGWAYQYWNIEEKERVFRKVRTQTGTKVEGADIVPATQLYTESYMVQFLVQNSLGATWMGMHPGSKLYEQWDYYVCDADRAPVDLKPVRELTFLDPACGSGHFLLEAFDLLYAMYEEEGELTEPETICDAILTQNLYGIDIDARAVQIAEAALWMKAAERVFDYEGVPTNLVAAVSSHLTGPHWDEFLAGFEKEPSVARVLRTFGESMEHIDELGSLARPNEELKKIIADEHAIWEKQVREKKEANYLFPEMREDSLSGTLPFEEISDEQFGHRLFSRARMALDSFTAAARDRGEFHDQFLGNEVSTGFKLLDLLAQSYDIVTANPPYMGSPSMGERVRTHLRVWFALGANDLFAAFILGCCRYARENGTIAMVTQQAWLFLRDYAKLRTSGGEGVLDRNHLELVAPLGPNAFEEISGEVVSPALFILRKRSPENESCITGIRVNQRAEWLHKAKMLADGAREGAALHAITFRDLQSLPEAPVVFWLGGQLFELLQSESRVSGTFDVRQGLATTDDPRFVRWWWEVSNTRRWYRFVKGGGYMKWWGFNDSRVDWERDGTRLKLYVVEKKANKHWSRRLASSDYYFRTGATYSDVASGCLGARVLPNSSLFAASSPGIFANRAIDWDSSAALAFFNSRIATFLARTTSPNPMHFSVGYVANLPFTPTDDPDFAALVSEVIRLKRELTAQPLASEEHEPNLKEMVSVAATISTRHVKQCAVLLIEALLESRICDLFALDAAAREALSTAMGTHAGAYCCDSDEVDWTVLGDVVSRDVLEVLRTSICPEHDAKEQTKPESSRPGDDEVSSSEDEDGVDVYNQCHPFPSEFVLEELAHQEQLNPLSLLARIQYSDEYAHIVDTAREEEWYLRAAEAVLALLGHQSAEFTRTHPGMADRDGIIPLAKYIEGDVSLALQIREYWQSTFKSEGDSVERDFTNTTGLTLAEWAGGHFFERHCTEFNGRPVAWHVRTVSRTEPTYACLVYYHRLDGDIVLKIQKQAEDLRKSFDVELRGILTTPIDSRSDRQEQRRFELDGRLEELREFDATLEDLAVSGFGPDSLTPTLRQQAIDDATLALKCHWLKRLNSFVADSVLSNWQDSAAKAEIHDNLPDWISQAVTHLQHHCVTVGIKPPKAKDVGDEPTSAELASLICGEASDMLIGSLTCACDVWWKTFDATVLAPLKAEIKVINEERDEIKTRLESDPLPEADEVMELKLRDKELLAKRRPLNAKLKRLKDNAKKIREDIEAWRSDEPLEWESWLGEQPLFDEVASIDGTRPAPTTIAEFVAQESAYIPDINDGVRVNIAPLQSAGLLAADVLSSTQDVNKAIADRAEWRADERRWVREGKLPQPGWWPEDEGNEA